MKIMNLSNCKLGGSIMPLFCYWYFDSSFININNPLISKEKETKNGQNPL